MSIHIPIPLLSFPKLLNILLRILIQPTLQITSIAHCEQKLQPHKQRRQEDGLVQVIEECGRAAFEDAVPNELRDPGEDVDADGGVGGGGVVVGGEMVGVGGGSEEEEGEGGAGDGLKEDVEGAVGEAG